MSQLTQGRNPTSPDATQLQFLLQEFCKLASLLSPFIGQDEMQKRYGVTGKTLLAMERRGEIPKRVSGRWLRSEVVEWESRQFQ